METELTLSLWISGGTFRDLAGIARATAIEALARCAQGGTWNGTALQVRKQGRAYQVHAASLPLELYKKFRDQNPELFKPAQLPVTTKTVHPDADLSRVTELEGELLRLLSAKFSAKDILEFRHKEYQVVQSELQESEAWGGTLRDQLDEARRGLRETEADLVKAHAEQSRALSMDALDKTQQAVIEAGRLKATVSALISNLEVALKRASAGFEVLRTKVGTAEKALWSAKAEASAETVKASPEFEVLKNSLMEGFAASVEACEEHNLGRYLAGVFGAKGVDGNQVVNELGVIRVALKGELGVTCHPGQPVTKNQFNS